MNDFAFVLTWPVTALLIAAAAVGILRYQALRVWLGLASIVAAVALLAAVPLACGLGAFVAFAASTPWVPLASVTMIALPAPDSQTLATREALRAAD